MAAYPSRVTAMKNAQIAAHFEELATLYELDGAVVYRVLAYRNAAKSIREAGVSVAEMSAQGRAEELDGHRQDDRREDRRAAGDRVDPVGATSSRPRSRWGSCRSRTSPGWAPSGCASSTTRWAWSRSTTCARRPSRAASRTCPGSAPRRRRRCWPPSPRAPTGAPRTRAAALARAGAGRGPGRGPARAPRRAAGGAGGQRAALGRQLQGPGHRGRDERPGGAGGGLRGAARAWTT